MGVRKKKKRKNLMLFLFIFLFLLIVGYYLYHEYNDYVNYKNRVSVAFKEDNNVEINSNVTILDFVNDIVNGVIINGDESIDTSSLGKKKVNVLLKNNKDEEEKVELLINVIDTQKPVIKAKPEVTVYVGDKIDLLSDVVVEDNSLEKVKALVVGEYDFNTIGEYKLKYEAVDSSDNKGEYEFILKVISDSNNRTFTTNKGYIAKVSNGITYIDGILIVNKTYSIPSNYGSGLTSDTMNAFNRMKSDATILGLNIYISSGYRSYWDQKYIYDNYVLRDGQALADTYSARAGHSEHQTGLAFDLNTISSDFAYTNEGKWVADNCYKYGFILRYPKGKDNITGYMYESWHLRYVGLELASKLYNDGNWITLEEYFGIASKYS